MPAPILNPSQRDPRDVDPTDHYHPADPVWVYRGGTWCAGVVETASAGAATVTYRPSGSRGTGVDTITAPYVFPRMETDPMLDKAKR
ncbi:hypothetical protein ACN27F_16155 [Solwaraspora sp. WMMB335]|uniref:hypothetical protein n=1 Tax=Solwaraspora sp. WMMB335 TaxID=3404118 RepID=UPI003B956829